MKKLDLVYVPSDETVVSDEKWLSFVIEQILSNALKYTNEGSVTISIEKPKTLCISDTGIGISPEDIPRKTMYPPPVPEKFPHIQNPPAARKKWWSKPAGTPPPTDSPHHNESKPEPLSLYPCQDNCESPPKALWLSLQIPVSSPQTPVLRS